ncbi:hypothetical protein [Shimia aestuarii]|uniref:Uncharacterized protein n=1 Tax=Shimia aestuarii TaxID=254406 RepID=A0A1I4ISJ2_9RHOB|nr:hypothetical protein [Shimia aestuarii]SFL57339.1 hypothetical protein SAMN04488042_101729 [Shimia aestuarii]
MSQQPKKHRLPIRFVDGAFEMEFGGAVPVADGAECELIISEDKISDPALLKSLRSKKAIRILEKGTKLIAMLSGSRPEEVTDELRQATLPADFASRSLGKWFERWERRSALRNFVEVEIGPADDRQRQLPDMESGGLWLTVQGWRAVGLESSQIILPECVSSEPATSLNHAYTLLSEAYEPWRISHTGNIYEQVLYQEGNGKWYPLEFLRDETELEEGQTIAKAHWERFLRDMKPRNPGQ